MNPIFDIGLYHFLVVSFLLVGAGVATILTKRNAIGILIGVELVADRESKKPVPEFGARVCRRCLELGLHINIVGFAGMGGIFRIAPPLTVTRKSIDLALSILDQAITETLDHFGTLG